MTEPDTAPTTQPLPTTPATQVIVQTPVFIQPEKNMMLALLLTFFFGGLGMLYATIPGAITMLLIGTPLLFFTGGIAGIIVWPVQLLWTYLAVRNHNTSTRQHAQQVLR